MARKNRELEDFRFCMEALTDDVPLMQSSAEMIAHPAYLEIMKLGPKLIPLIFKEMKNGSFAWNYAYSVHRTGGAVPQCFTAYVFVIGKAFGQWVEKPKPVRNLCSVPILH
jgi:hypothetical protein